MRSGLALIRTPSHRQQVAGRWWMAVAAILALAVASGLVGSFVAPKAETPGKATTGPFSYFPHS